MITRLTINNFKSIRRQAFSLAPLNLAMGLNGMGKSSFIQSLLLLGQSDNIRDGELRLNDRFVSLGRGKDAFYQYGKIDEFSFLLEGCDQVSALFNFEYAPEADYFQSLTLHNDDKTFDLPLFNGNFKYLNAERLAPKVIYERSYSEVVSKKSLGINGQFTTHFLNEYGGDEISFDNLVHKNTERFFVEGVEKVDKSLITQVNHWLSEISPGIKINTPEIPNSDNILLNFQYLQPNRGYTNSFRATNVGFGIAYVLPVVTLLLSAKPNHLIVLENPECHIHPRGQVELGRLIALLASNDIQIIVETHSDHILNGIRVAIKEVDCKPERVKVFYFDKVVDETEQYSRVHEIRIDRYGELSDYPAHFMDEWGNQLLKLL